MSSFPWDARRNTLTFFVCVQVRARLQKMGALASMNIFLRQEIDRMQRVITLVRQTLTDLKLAIEGTIIMSEVFRNLLTLNEALFLSGCPICQWTAQLRNHHSKEKFDWRYVLVRNRFFKECEYSISFNRNYRDDQFKITMKSLSDVAVNFCSLCSLFFPETSKQKKKKSKT